MSVPEHKARVPYPSLTACLNVRVVFNLSFQNTVYADCPEFVVTCPKVRPASSLASLTLRAALTLPWAHCVSECGPRKRASSASLHSSRRQGSRAREVNPIQETGTQSPQPGNRGSGIRASGSAATRAPELDRPLLPTCRSYRQPRPARACSIRKGKKGDQREADSLPQSGPRRMSPSFWALARRLWAGQEHCCLTLGSSRGPPGGGGSPSPVLLFFPSGGHAGKAHTPVSLPCCSDFSVGMHPWPCESC